MTGFLLRSLATLLVMAGVAACAAGVVSFRLLSTTASARPFAAIVFQMAAAALLGGVAASYFLRSSRVIFLNEGPPPSTGEQTEVGGWLVIMAIALAGLPVWMLLNVRDFLGEWRGILRAVAASDIWQGGASGMAGIVLIPIFAALAPPFLELLTVLGFVIASTTLLVLLTGRKRTFPRFYVVWMLLLSALVILCVRGAAAGALAGGAVERALRESPRDAVEAAPILDYIGRYISVVTTTARVLLWTLGGYLIWLPLILFSSRIRSTFQS